MVGIGWVNAPFSIWIWQISDVPDDSGLEVEEAKENVDKSLRIVPTTEDAFWRCGTECGMGVAKIPNDVPA